LIDAFRQQSIAPQVRRTGIIRRAAARDANAARRNPSGSLSVAHISGSDLGTELDVGHAG
jgi:hypothetical protein